MPSSTVVYALLGFHEFILTFVGSKKYFIFILSRIDSLIQFLLPPWAMQSTNIQIKQNEKILLFETKQKQQVAGGKKR